MAKYNNLNEFLSYVATRDPNQPEFLQAVKEVFISIWDFIEANPKYKNEALLERLVEPDRAIQFRVAWVDDQGNTQVNRAFRVQYNNAIGPYKGGMRFHPSVNLSILKFLGFEQVFKNSLTTLPLGGGKGGSDFDPKGKSDNEVMRFCQALLAELYRYVGADVDIPAGDIGVGAREVGYMTGYYKKYANNTGGTFTGKGLTFGGSLIRPEATGYGLVYFVDNILKESNSSLKDKVISVSGSGNVAQYAIEKCIQLGGKVVTCSDSSGYVYDPNGFTAEKLASLMEIKNVKRGRVSDYAALHGLEFVAKGNVWEKAVEVALPCATQNELDLDSAKLLINNGVKIVAEGANMPTTIEATDAFLANNVKFAPGKAANAGGVATSGLEMSQNSMRFSWSKEEVDTKLQNIMKDIHANCVKYGKQSDGSINYVKGANIAGFVKVADAMLAQGVY